MIKGIDKKTGGPVDEACVHLCVDSIHHTGLGALSVYTILLSRAETGLISAGLMSDELEFAEYFSEPQWPFPRQR